MIYTLKDTAWAREWFEEPVFHVVEIKDLLVVESSGTSLEN